MHITFTCFINTILHRIYSQIHSDKYLCERCKPVQLLIRTTHMLETMWTMHITFTCFASLVLGFTQSTKIHASGVNKILIYITHMLKTKWTAHITFTCFASLRQYVNIHVSGVNHYKYWLPPLTTSEPNGLSTSILHASHTSLIFLDLPRKHIHIMSDKNQRKYCFTPLICSKTKWTIHTTSTCFVSLIF